MYYRQVGFFPRLTQTIGFLVACYGLFGWFWFVINIFRLINTNQYNLLIIAQIFFSIIFSTIFLWLPFYLIGSGIYGIFPDLNVSSKGLRIRKYIFFSRLVKWDEIDDIVRIKKPVDGIALIIDRKGLFLINGLYFEKMYGGFAGSFEPAVIISKQFPGFEDVFDAIERLGKLDSYKTRLNKK